MCVSTIGAAGMTAAAMQFSTAAANTASGRSDPNRDVANQISAANDFKASAAVVKTGDKMLGTLVDLKT